MRDIVKIFFCALAFGTAHGQWKDPVPQSPEATALSTALNYPVSHSTGIPDISVPLFNVKVGQLELPFALSYHAGGHKVGATEGPAGLGWSLSPTLQVSRSIRGVDDFWDLGGDYGTGYAYNKYCRGENGDYPLLGNADTTKLKLYNSWKRNHDQEPDQFNYNLLGKSGSFFFRKDTDGTLHIVPSPYNGVKIELATNVQGIVIGFKITDTDGTLYYFDNVVEKTGNPLQSEHDWVYYSPVTVWKCRKVFSANKIDTLDFHYSDAPSIYSYSSSATAEFYDYVNNGCSPQFHFYAGMIESQYEGTSYSNMLRDYQDGTKAGETLEPTPRYIIKSSDPVESGVRTPYMVQNQNLVYVPAVPTPRYIEAVGSLRSVKEIRHKKLDRITFNGGEVRLNYYSGSSQLLKMWLSRDGANPIREVDFNQSLEGVVPSYDGNTFDRFEEAYTYYLDSLTIDDEQTYSFRYHNKKVFTNYNSRSDAWGYPQGGVINSLLPKIRQTLTIFGDICNYSESYTTDFGSGSVFGDFIEGKKGILDKITYPTGGSTVFTYEGNLGNEAALTDLTIGTATPVGGLRIKKIKNYGSDGNLASTKWYVYGKNGSGVGFARGIDNNDPLFGRKVLVSGSSLTLLDNAPEIYSYAQNVKYYKLDPAFNDPNAPLVERTREDYYLDHLETKKTWLSSPRYDISFANGTPIYYEEVTEHFANYSDPQTGGPGTSELGKTVYTYEHPNTHGHGFGQAWLGTNRTGIHLSWQLGKLKSVTDMKFESHQYDTIRNRTYDYEKFLRNEKIYYGQTYAIDVVKGLPEEEEYKEHNIIYGYQALDVGNVLLESETETLYNASGSISSTKDYVYDEYGQLERVTVDRSQGGQMVSVTKRASHSDYTNSPPPYVADLVSNNMLSLPLQQVAYEDGKVTGGSENRYYADGTGHLKEVYQLEPEGLYHTLDPLDFKRRISLSYDSGRPVEMEPEDGSHIYYVWGYNKMYPIAKLENFTASQASAVQGLIDAAVTASNADNDRTFGTAGKEGSLRTALKNIREDAATSGAMVSTYTYDPLVGVTSMTDPGGRTVYYIYDNLNRLKEVRDKDNNLVTDHNYHYKGQ